MAAVCQNQIFNIEELCSKHKQRSNSQPLVAGKTAMNKVRTDMTQKQSRKWEARFPDLDVPWTHWQTDGDGQVLGVFAAQELGRALSTVKENWAFFALIHAQPAQIGEDGTLLLHPRRAIIVNRAKEVALAAAQAETEDRMKKEAEALSRHWWGRIYQWITNSPPAEDAGSTQLNAEPGQVPDGNISPQLHRQLNGMLRILIGILTISFLLLIQVVTVETYSLATRFVFMLASAFLGARVIWVLLPRFMRNTCRARCPACGKTMDFGYQSWPVAEGYPEPDVEQGSSYLEYHCRACGATHTCNILKKMFPFDHQITNFWVSVIFFLFFCEVIFMTVTGELVR